MAELSICDMFSNASVGFLHWLWSNYPDWLNKEAAEGKGCFIRDRRTVPPGSLLPRRFKTMCDSPDTALGYLPKHQIFPFRDFMMTCLESRNSVLALHGLMPAFSHGFIVSKPSINCCIALGATFMPFPIQDYRQAFPVMTVVLPRTLIKWIEKDFDVKLVYTHFTVTYTPGDPGIIITSWGPRSHYGHLVVEWDTSASVLVVDEALKNIAFLGAGPGSDPNMSKAFAYVARIVMNHSFLMSITGHEDAPFVGGALKHKLRQLAKQKNHHTKGTIGRAGLAAFPRRLEIKGHQSTKWFRKAHQAPDKAPDDGSLLDLKPGGFRSQTYGKSRTKKRWQFVRPMATEFDKGITA